VKKYRCIICSHIYDPAVGDPDTGIPPGTPFEKLPDSWICPDCGASKDDFEALDD
jgi:rubredoxin